MGDLGLLLSADGRRALSIATRGHQALETITLRYSRGAPCGREALAGRDPAGREPAMPGRPERTQLQGSASGDATVSTESRPGARACRGRESFRRLRVEGHGALAPAG